MNSKFVEIKLYHDEKHPVVVKSIVDLKNNTLWTTQKLMGELFAKDVTTIADN